jgi:hypothetical protein
VTVVVVLVIVVLALLLAGSLIGLAFSLLWLALVGIAASLLGGILADVFDVGWLIPVPRRGRARRDRDHSVRIDGTRPSARVELSGRHGACAHASTAWHIGQRSGGADRTMP